jgi:uncharacterized membrane protein HdeD (DUF308 family)
MSKSKAALTRRSDPLLGDLGRNWGWILALGLFYLVLGLVGLAMLFGLTVVNILFIGVLMLAGGVAQVLETVKCKGWKGTLWHLAIAALYVTGGLVVIYDPASASRLISLAVGGVLTAIGLARILIARQLQAKGAGWIWMLLTGLAGAALGLMIMLEWPLSGLFAIALFVAVDLLLQGSSYVTLALTARRQVAA